MACRFKSNAFGQSYPHFIHPHIFCDSIESRLFVPAKRKAFLLRLVGIDYKAFNRQVFFFIKTKECIYLA